MRTTIDIPDETYRKLKVKAALEGQTVREIALRGIQRELGPAEAQSPRKKFQIPVIRSEHPGKLHLTNEDIDDILASS
jgi:plasmid stability protein